MREQEALVDLSCRCRLEVVGQDHLLQLAGPDPRGGRGDRGGETGNGQFGVRVAHPARGFDRHLVLRPAIAAVRRPVPRGRAMCAIGVRWTDPGAERRAAALPKTIAGTIATETSSSSKPSETKATSPVPGNPTSSRTPMPAQTSANHCWICCAASGPVVLNRSCTPQPTRPLPCRRKHSDPVGRASADSRSAGTSTRSETAVTANRVVGTAVTSAKSSRRMILISDGRT